MKKYLILSIVVLVLAAAGGYFFLAHRPSTGSPRVESAQVVANSDPVSTPDPSAPVKEFTVDGTNYAFSPSTITVNKGDNVKINFKDDDGVHNLVIDGYNVSTDTIDGGSQSSVQFVADKAGTFEYFCSIGSHRALGMTGTLIVK